MRYIIIGAVAGGASTAARLRRLDEYAEILIFERGAYISYANCGLPYYIGDVIKDRNKLFVQTAASFNQRFNIDVRVRTEVTSIDPNAKTITATDLNTGIVYQERYDKLVLSPGAEPLRPLLPGINSAGIFTLRNVMDTDLIKTYANQHPQGTAVVIGGGFIGLEMAENLHKLGMKVSVIEMGNQVLAPVDFPIAAIVQEHIRSKGVRLFLNTKVAGFELDADGLKVMIEGANSLQTDLVILSIGVRPDTRLAVAAGLKIGEAKGIFVNEFLQTSNPDIYAVGDAIEFKNPITQRTQISYLAGPANKQGRICANNIVGGNIESYKGAINTSIVQVFDLTIGASGLAAKHLKSLDIPHVVSTTHHGSHASYYPDARPMTIQISFSPSDGQLLGAQVIGYEGADKRLDVLASIIKLNGSIHDLCEFEHAYAPPYSSAKDPVNMAGFVADNILQDKLRVFYWNELASISKEDLLIDVRTELEFQSGAIENAINIPIDALRSRLSEIPIGKTIYIYCEAGLRGYFGQRILRQYGYKSVFNLSGGYKLWKVCTAQNAV